MRKLLPFLLTVLGTVNSSPIADDSKVEASLPTIEIIGSKFFNSETGEQFFMKGIAYQPSRTTTEITDTLFDTKYIDPLADTEICLRDLPHLQDLNINTVRVYSIDPTKNHDKCMKAFADAGIYVVADLAEPDISIPRDHPTWDVTIWKRYKDVVDSLHHYSNVLGFFAGNEVTNDFTNTDASPFVKAAIRDVKAYIKTKGYRPIPVGYSSNDDADTRDYLANYFACDTADVRADFYGLNMYEWCGYSSYGTSGYKERTKEFQDYPIPIFFSEFGCNLVRPRPFTEIGALFGSKMSPVWSGGLVYMYFEEENEYGVAEIDASTGEVKLLDDFKFLQKEFAKAEPEGITKSEYIKKQRHNKNVECPKQDSTWKASVNLPPTPDIDKCICFEDCLPCSVAPFEDNEEYEKLFEYVCGQVNCSDIGANGSNGEYGDYSDCSILQKLGLEISKMFEQNGGCPLVDKQVYFNRNYKSSECKEENTMEKINEILAGQSQIKYNENPEPAKKAGASNNTRTTTKSGTASAKLRISGMISVVAIAIIAGILF